MDKRITNMTTEIRNTDTLVNALTELNELLQRQPEAISGLLVDLLGQSNAQKFTKNTYQALQWLAARLQEMTDAAEALDSVAALAEIVVELFRFLGEGIQAMTSDYDPDLNLPGLTELTNLFQSSDSASNVLEAMEWLPDPDTIALLQQHTNNLIVPPAGGLYLIMENIESNLIT